MSLPLRTSWSPTRTSRNHCTVLRRSSRHSGRLFPDLEITAEEVVASENSAVVRWTYRATHQCGVLFGVEAAGRRVEVQGITLYRIDRGVVRHEEGVVDNLSLMSQLQASAKA
jgi:predicted ester cyclase